MKPDTDTPELRAQVALDLQEIRLLARQIKTPAAFTALLDRIPEPAMRAHVRELLRPLVGFAQLSMP